VNETETKKPTHTYDVGWHEVTIEHVEMRKSQKGVWLMNFRLGSDKGKIWYTQPVDDANRGYVTKLLTRLGVSVEDMSNPGFWNEPNRKLRNVLASIKVELDTYRPDDPRLRVKVLTSRKANRTSQFAADPTEVSAFALSAAAMFATPAPATEGGDESW